MKLIMAFILAMAALPATAQDNGESALLLVSGSSAGIGSYIQGVTNSALATSATASAITVTAGDLVAAASKAGDSSGGANATFALTSTGVSCTWSYAPITSSIISNAQYSAAMGWCVVSSSGSMTVTETWSGSGPTGFSDISLAEFRSSTGFPPNPLDVLAITTPNPETAVTTTCSTGSTAATANTNDLVIGVCEDWNIGQTYGAGGPGYTYESASSSNTTGVFWKSVSTTGTQSFSTAVNSDAALGILVALKMN